MPAGVDNEPARDRYRGGLIHTKANRRVKRVIAARIVASDIQRSWRAPKRLASQYRGNHLSGQTHTQLSAASQWPMSTGNGVSSDAREVKICSAAAAYNLAVNLNV